MDKKLYTQADFLNLTVSEVKDIGKILELEIPNGEEGKVFLFNKLDELEEDAVTNNIISQRLLAGKTTVKWFSFEYDPILIKEELINKLESPENGFETNILERADICDSINSIIKDNNIYTLKIFLHDPNKIVNNGINIISDANQISNIVVKINIENCWIEMRCPESKCRKVGNILQSQLGIHTIGEINILKNYNNDISTFKNDLIDGMYINYTAMPMQPVILTDDDAEKISNLISSIDNYLLDKDSVKLMESLKELEFESERLSLVAILLAGLDNMRMGVKKSSGVDMSQQSLYKILKDHIIENSSWITFSTQTRGDKYTMRVGLKTNFISFRSSVTEFVISYIRNKIL